MFTSKAVLLSRTARSPVTTSVAAAFHQVVTVRPFSDKKAKGKAAATPPPPAAAATSDASQHRPVIHLNGLAAKYANATYVVASQAGQLDKIETELQSLAKSATSSAKFADFLFNPLIARDVKTTAVTAMDQLSPITRNLLITMAGNARLAELPKVVSTFTQLMKAKRGQVDAKIISAEPLSPAMLKEVQTAMQSQVAAGQTVIIEQVTDPSIVGGLQVQIGDQFLDLSIKSRIDEIARMPVS
jgi:F-type H+-transporting ATPase subunit O